MIVFPIGELMDDRICTLWLERHLHLQGLRCPHCGSGTRCLFRDQGHFPAYRRRACEGYYTLLTGTVFAKTRQRFAILVLWLRGIAKGEPTAHLARALGVSRKPLYTLRQRLQAYLNATAPTDLMTGTAFEADELYQNVGEKGTPHLDPADPPRWHTNKRKGHGTFANARPSIINIVSRDTGEGRFWGCDHATKHTCYDVSAANVPVGGTILYTDAWQSYDGSHPSHATVRYGVHEWACDDNGDGRREVYCHTCEGAGTALRTYLRAFRGNHKQYLHLSVATYEARFNATQITPHLF
jgi:transposase-like protein